MYTLTQGLSSSSSSSRASTLVTTASAIQTVNSRGDYFQRHGRLPTCCPATAAAAAADIAAG